MKEKTHWKKYFDYNYFGSYSLEDYEGDPVLTIKELKRETVKDQNGKDEECLVCHWVENEKPMILNKTNCKIIEKLYKSPHVEDWRGKRVQIYAARVRAFGKETDGLRIRDFIPKSEAESELKQLKGQIRGLISAYAGIDLDQIRTDLNEAVKAKTDSVEFYKSIIERLKA